MHPRCKAIESIHRQYSNHSLIVQVWMYLLEILLQLFMAKCLAVIRPVNQLSRTAHTAACAKPALCFHSRASMCFILNIWTSSSSHYRPNYTPQKQNPLHVFVRDLAQVHWNIHHKDNKWDIIPVDELKGQLLELQGGEGPFCFLVSMFNIK